MSEEEDEKYVTGYHNGSVGQNLIEEHIFLNTLVCYLSKTSFVCTPHIYKSQILFSQINFQMLTNIYLYCSFP